MDGTMRNRMIKINKYPRTYHIAGSRTQPGDDDLEDVPVTTLAGRHLVIEEKVDGANAAISFDQDGTLLLQSRGHYLSGGYRERHFDLFKRWAHSIVDTIRPVIGARYVGIPFFGPRVSFGEGETEARARIEISDPTTDASGVGVAEVMVQVEWIGGEIALQEIHRLRHDGDAVIQVAEDARAGATPPFRTRLPEGATRFVARSSGFEDQVEDGRMAFDYTLRDGVVERSNALALMRLVGLDVDDAPES